MLRSVSIGNFKSIVHCDIELARFNVFIGANGCGKSNLLEGIALGLAAAGNSLENDYLVARGIRLSTYVNMTSHFSNSSTINLKFKTDSAESEIEIATDTSGFTPKLRRRSGNFTSQQLALMLLADDLAIEGPVKRQHIEMLRSILRGKAKVEIKINSDAEEQFSMKISDDEPEIDPDEEIVLSDDDRATLKREVDAVTTGYPDIAQYKDFTIYAPERSSILKRRKDTSVPVGYLGEGAFELLSFMAKHREEVFREMCDHLTPIDWFDRMEVEFESPTSESDAQTFFFDKYVGNDVRFSSRAANEGLLLLMFYFVLILSEETPKVFAIENVDQSLNPRLCRHLAREMTHALRKSQKQAFVTVHNPVFLDGLDLRRKDTKLFVVKRDYDGETKIREVTYPERFYGNKKRLSEAFMDGQIGGLPNNF